MNTISMNRSLENGFSYLLASDFDQTLSFNDSGYVLCDLLGIHGFEEKAAGLGKSKLVHQGAELACLLRQDIRELFSACGVAIHDWDTIRTDLVTFQRIPTPFVVNKTEANDSKLLPAASLG